MPSRQNHPDKAAIAVMAIITIVLVTVAIILGVIAFASHAKADWNFSGSTSIESIYRGGSGTEFTDGPIATGFLGANNEGWDISGWVATKGSEKDDLNIFKEIQEVDAKLGYTWTQDNLWFRTGLARWFCPDSTINNLSLKGGANNLFNFMDANIEALKLISHNGLQITGYASKTISVGNVRNTPLNLTLSAKAVWLDDFFGRSGHVNDVYGFNLGIGKSLNVIMDLHDGHDIGNAVVGKVVYSW